MKALLDLLFGGAWEFRRALGVRALLLALVAGLLWGPLRGVIPAELLPRAGVLVPGALLAALLAGDRDGLAALRRVAPTALPSSHVVGARLLGGGVAACVLVVAFSTGASLTAGERIEERALVGLSEGLGERWRFELPAGSSGEFVGEVVAWLPHTRRGTLGWTVQRGAESARGEVGVTEAGRVRLPLPDLSPARGNLRLLLEARDGLVLGSDPPRLLLGSEAIPVPPQRWSSQALLRLALVALVTLGASCAFGAPTACLAGGLVLLAPAGLSPGMAGVFALVVAVLATLGFALRRRTLLA